MFNKKIKNKYKRKYKTIPFYNYIPRYGNYNWIYEKGMCELCKYNKATYNLDLSLGTHRLCALCRDFN